MKNYQIIFTDKLNQRILGGQYWTLLFAEMIARHTVEGGNKATWQIVRMSDKVTLAQSKEATQS